MLSGIFSKKTIAFASSLCLAVVLFLAIARGIAVGRGIAETELVSRNAQSIVLALQFFYQDQNRYPTALEFKDINIMLPYLSSFPPAQIISGDCAQSFIYRRISLSKFQLNFCLPRPTGQYKRGWNTLNIDKIEQN